MEETTITIRHVEQKFDDEVQRIRDKDNTVSKNWVYLQILELGLRAFKKGYRFSDDIPLK